MKSAIREEFLQTRSLQGLGIIDIHTHMGDVYGTGLSRYTAEECVRIMDEHGIDSIWCAPHSDLFDPGSVNTAVEQLLRSYPQRIRGYFSFNPNYAERFFERLSSIKTGSGYVGIKLLPEYHRTSLEHPAYRKMLDFADSLGLVVLIHTWGGSSYNSASHVEQLLKRYSNIKLIMGHSVPNECGRAIELAARYKNAYLDLCDIHRHSGIVQRMVEGAGSEKVLFGTDMPWYDFTYCAGSVIFADITDRDMRNIFSENAKIILKDIKV